MYKYQFGVREKHSTQQAIISLVEKITESWDTGDIVYNWRISRLEKGL